MIILEALRGGIRALYSGRRVIFAFYAATTAAALLITAPIMAIAFQSLGESALAHQMTANIDVSWIAELFAAYGATPWMQINAVLIVAGSISAVVYLFLLGGALQVFCTGEPFFAGSGRNFWRLVRLTLVSLLFYGVVWVVYNRIGAVGRKIWGAGSEAGPLIHWNWFCAVVLLCLLGLVNLVFDYARIVLVAGDRRKAIRATIEACRFVWKNLGPAAGLYAIVCAIAAILFAFYLGISHSFAQSSLGLVLLLFLVRQAMVMAKIWSRLLFSTTAIELYAALQPEPVPTLPEEDAAATAGRNPPHVEIALSPALGINAFEFIASWNQTPEARAAAEASLYNLGGGEGVVFDPERLLGHTAVLRRLAAGVDSTVLHNLIHQTLDSHGPHRPHQICEEPGPDGSLLFKVDALQE